MGVEWLILSCGLSPKTSAAPELLCWPPKIHWLNKMLVWESRGQGHGVSLCPACCPAHIRVMLSFNGTLRLQDRPVFEPHIHGCSKETSLWPPCSPYPSQENMTCILFPGSWGHWAFRCCASWFPSSASMSSGIWGSATQSFQVLMYHQRVLALKRPVTLGMACFCDLPSTPGWLVLTEGL